MMNEAETVASLTFSIEFVLNFAGMVAARPGVNAE
jgi:hypothetical protein